MIVIDANYFLRYLVHPVTPEDREMSGIAADLFGRVRAGEEIAATSDAVVAEVVFILSDKRHYGVGRSDVVTRLGPLLQVPGLRLPRKRRCLRALDLWATTPRISYVDALTAEQAFELGATLASFDRVLQRVPGVTVWRP